MLKRSANEAVPSQHLGHGREKKTMSTACCMQLQIREGRVISSYEDRRISSCRANMKCHGGCKLLRPNGPEAVGPDTERAQKNPTQPNGPSQARSNAARRRGTLVHAGKIDAGTGLFTFLLLRKTQLLFIFQRGGLAFKKSTCVFL